MITFEPTETVSSQLAQLVQITGRSLNDLLDDLVAGTLNQMFVDKDADLLADAVLDGVSYPTREQAQSAADGYNAFRKAILRERGQFHVRTAYVDDSNTVQLTESALLKV
jgi:hypothetical protein